MSDSCRRDRGALVALGLILAAVVLAAWITAFQNRPGRYESGDGNPQPQEHSAEDAIGRIPSADSFDPWRDSYAQWGMFGFSAIATGISIVAVVWVRRAWREAKRSADAAIANVDVTKEIARRQLRAYLATDSMGLGQRVDGKNIDYVLKLKNFGQTPANQVKLKVRTGLCNGDDGIVHWGEFVERPSVDVPPSQFLGVQIEVFGINETNISEKIESIIARRAKLHAHAVYSYIDIYSMKRTTGFYASTWGDTFRLGEIGIDVYETEKDDGVQP
ncbi:hypothetical protein VQ044_08475 [Aurantimonas sp. C2-5-R2]|uniref:hypothetical protein n=1 Tax=Aurantimonas sp. C2-4-R8 TaxID=3114364 RepID=UPI002E18076C